MKKHLLLPILSAIFCLAAFTGCDDDDNVYTFLDRNLVGQWDLIFINGRPVSGYSQNFFDFYSDGSGKYYYYENGVQYWEWIDWWCYNTNYAPVLHVVYSSGAPLNCNYTFNSNATRLYLSWSTPGGGTMEYVYEYTGPAQSPDRQAMERVLKASGMQPGANSETAPGQPAVPSIETKSK